MTVGQRVKTGRSRIGSAAAIGAIALLLPACTTTRGHTGYVMDNALVAAVQPGIDNKESVQRTLGSPSFAGEFDPATWYYVSRTTRQFSFGLPKPVAETVVAVRFDPAGNVAGVERTGLDKVVRLSPVGDKTPTLGRRRSLVQELFGNIGAVGSAGQTGTTADNPNGGSPGGGR